MSDDTTDADEVKWEYLYHPDTLVREPWGELDLGIVREEPPVAHNDLRMFAEQWEGIVGCLNGRPDCRVAGPHRCGDGWLFVDGGTLDLGLIRDSGCRCRWTVTRRLHRVWSWVRWGGWRR